LNAPQKGSSRPRKTLWATSSIQAILKSAQEYASGIKIYRRKGEIFQIPIEPILDPTTYERFIRIREQKKNPPGQKHKTRLFDQRAAVLCMRTEMEIENNEQTT